MNFELKGKRKLYRELWEQEIILGCRFDKIKASVNVKDPEPDHCSLTRRGVNVELRKDTQCGALSLAGMTLTSCSFSYRHPYLRVFRKVKSANWRERSCGTAV